MEPFLSRIQSRWGSLGPLLRQRILWGAFLGAGIVLKDLLLSVVACASLALLEISSPRKTSSNL